MMRSAAGICLVTIIGFVANAFAELVIIPKDTESIVGGSAYFNCSTAGLQEIQWFHYTVGGSSEKNLVYGFNEVRGSYVGRFSVQKNIATGEYHLVIIAILTQDAGVYECQDDVGHGNKSQAQLIVLESSPECQSDMPDAKVLGKNTCNIEPDVFRLTCTATYRGNFAPVLQWMKVGESTAITQGVSPPVISQGRITFNLTLNGDLVADGTSYVCQTTRSTSKEQYSCASGAIRVFSPQNDFKIASQKVGGEVLCPTIVEENVCSYRWLNTDQIVVSDRNKLRLNDPGLYRCEADCRIKEKPCTLTANVVYVAEEASTSAPFAGDQNTSNKSSSSGLIVIIIITAILMIIFLGLFILYFLRWRKLSSESKKGLHEMQPLNKENLVAPGVPCNVVYSSNPSQVKSIKTQCGEANDRSIKGVAILNNELFIISQFESEVEVFDCTTLRFHRNWQINDLMDPDDATACIRNRCIYISDNKAAGKEIFRVDVDGNIIARWQIGEESGRLSVTDQSSVLLSLHDSSKLKEYSADGVLIREIKLASTGLTHPMHGVQLSNGNFVVTQGYLIDSIHRVCEVNSDGKLVRSFGAEKGSGSGNLTNPTYLAVDREGSILIADAGNGRVILIGSNFEYKRDLVTRNSGLHIPTRVCLDEINGRLYVAEYKKEFKSLLVFNIRS